MIVETNKNTSTGKYEVDIKTNGVVAELEANKEVSIDVSNYSEPVEITPSSGKNGMEKATITLTNISSGSSGTTAYGWIGSNDNRLVYTNYSVAPNDNDEFGSALRFNASNSKPDIKTQEVYSIEVFGERVSDTEFTTTVRGSAYQTYTRDSSKDFTLWETNQGE